MDERSTDSGIPIKPVYSAGDVADLDLAHQPPPGEFPFLRGVQPDMYRGRLWTMRQYAGYGSAKESNERYRYLLARGQTGLSVAFDLPTQMGFDSDASQAAGEVGRTGVAIDTIEDMELLLDGIPQDRVSVSMTINAPAAILLALYLGVARRRGIGFDVRVKAVLVFLLDQSLDCLGRCAHLSLKNRSANLPAAPFNSFNSFNTSRLTLQPFNPARSAPLLPSVGARRAPPMNGDVIALRRKSSRQRKPGLSRQINIKNLIARIAIKMTMFLHIRTKPRRTAL